MYYRPPSNHTFMLSQVLSIPTLDMTHERQKQCVENYKHQRIIQVWSILQYSARSLGPTCSSKTEGELPWPGEHTHPYTHIQTNTDTGLMSPSCEWLRDTARQQLMWRGGRTCWPTKQREGEKERMRGRWKDGGKVRERWGSGRVKKWKVQQRCTQLKGLTTAEKQQSCVTAHR